MSAGSLFLYNLLKLGALGAAVWLGAKFAQSVFGFGQPAVGGSAGASNRSSSGGTGRRGWQAE
jgi:hypothetical protein